MSTPSRNIRNRTSSGVAERAPETFNDVKIALHKYLLRTDEVYRKASENWYHRRKPKEMTANN